MSSINLLSITPSDVAAVINDLPVKVKPNYLARLPDPTVSGIQWSLLTPAEVNMVKEFLAQIKTGPVRIKVDAKLAVAILVALNWKNARKLRLPTALYYASEMQGKRWHETSDMIALNLAADRLVNGQHRLVAIDICKIPQNLTFCKVSSEAEKVIDQMLRRSTSAVTQLNPAICAAARNMNNRYQHYNGATSPFVIENIYLTYKKSIDLVINQPHLRKNGAIHGTFAFCHGQLEEYPSLQKKLTKFLTQVSEGLMLKEKDNAYILREWLNNAPLNGKSHGDEMYRRIIRSAYMYLYDKSDASSVDVYTAEKFFNDINREKSKVFQGKYHLFGV